MLCCTKPSVEELVLEVILLDDTTLSFQDNIHFKKDDKAQDIFDIACDHLKLTEREYFGLYYHDGESQANWFDLYRRLEDHKGFAETESPHQIYFGVRFYVADPSNLTQEVTRHQFFLQLKRNIAKKELECDFKKSTELAALAVQSELGDYQRDRHLPGYVSSFHFSMTQGEAFNHEVEHLHTKYTGLTPAKAEQMYLRKCVRLDMYGVDTHLVDDEYGSKCILGLSSKGIEVRKNKRKVKTYYWPLIKHIEFKDKQLKLQVKHRNCEDSIDVFTASSRSVCKRLWKRAIEQHAFFRMAPSYVASQDKGKSRLPTHTDCNSVDDVKLSKNTGSTEHEVMLTDNGMSKEVIASSNQSLLEQRGLFGKHSDNRERNMYVTPKSERRERNRHLRSLSDSENKHHKVRSRHGRSSGEESDSPSKRKIRSRNRSRGSNQGFDEFSPRGVPLGNYHTDTEAVKTGFGKMNYSRSGKVSEADQFDDFRSDAPRSARSRRKNMRKNVSHRLSKEDMHAQKMLWQHIMQQADDPAKYTQDQLRDIPYTEVKTDGNPLPIRLRRHSRRTSASSATKGIRILDGSGDAGTELISPLKVTTAIARDGVTLGKQTSELPHYNSRGGKESSKSRSLRHDWDTKRSYKSDSTRY